MNGKIGILNLIRIMNGGTIMVKSKPKQEKPEETTEEFVKRINQHNEWGKRNGSKRRTGYHHRG